VQGKMRSFVKFEELKQIPAGSTIISAQLSFFGVVQSEHYSQNNIGDNSFVLRKVLSNWSDTIINWNNQPSSSNVNEVTVYSNIQSRTPDFTNIDVTQLINDLYADSSNNFGISVSLLNEQQEASTFFNSSESSDYTFRPILTLVLRSPCAFISKQIFLSYSPKIGKICKDAIVGTRGGGSGGVASYDASNINLGTLPDLAMSTWTYGGTPGVSRSYLEFNSLTDFILGYRPNQMKILSARLFLYGVANPTHSPQGNCRSCPENINTDSDNSCWISRVTAPWQENTITWNNAPMLASGSVEIPISRSKYNWDVNSLDITDLLNNMIQNPNNQHGFAIRLKDESLSSTDNAKKRSLTFAGFDYPDISKHPRVELVVMYNASNSYFERELVIQPPASVGEDTRLILFKNGGGTTNYGTYPELSAGVWRTGSGNFQHVDERSLLKFDLSSFNQTKFITKADLFLSPTGNTSNSGSTGSWLNRTTSPWSELSVNWNSQPTFTEINRKWIPQHTSSNNYSATVNVTSLVQDMIREPNYGFLWRLNDERFSSGASGTSPNRWIGFASSDHANSWRRPKLVIKYIDQCPPFYVTYSKSQSLYQEAQRDVKAELIDEQEKQNTNLKISPNPIINNTIGILYFSNEAGFADVFVTNPAGIKVVISQKRILVKGLNRIMIDGANLPSGVYYVNLTQNGITKVQKFAK
jgi:hypothetical protein